MRKTELMSLIKPLSEKECSGIIESFYQKYSRAGDAGDKFFVSQLDEFKETMKDWDLYNYHQQGGGGYFDLKTLCFIPKKI